MFMREEVCVRGYVLPMKEEQMNRVKTMKNEAQQITVEILKRLGMQVDHQSSLF